MPITNQDDWNTYVGVNKDPYGGACVNVARAAMEILDQEPGPFDPHELICRADKRCNAGGITEFMAGAAASMISRVHSRGDEFRRAWNNDVAIGDEGEKANESGGILNPALLHISTNAD